MGDETSSSCYEKMKTLLRKAKPYLLVVGLQFGFAATYIAAKNTLNRGFNRYALVVYRNAFAALIFAPFAFFLERYVVSPNPS